MSPALPSFFKTLRVNSMAQQTAIALGMMSLHTAERLINERN